MELGSSVACPANKGNKMSTISSSSCAYEAIVRTSHTSLPVLTTTTCTSVPFTNPAFTTPSLAQRPETRTTTRWERTRHNRQRNEKHCETERRSNSENADQVCVTLWTPDVLGQGPARQSRGADAVFPRHRRVKSLWLHLIWGAGPVCNRKKRPAVHTNKAWKPFSRAIESAVPHIVVTSLSGPAARRVITTSLWPL